MNIFFKMKHWLIKSTWQSWFICGCIIIVLATLYREAQIEKIATTQLKEAMGIIQNANQNMQKTKNIIETNNKTIDSEFNHSSEENEESSENAKNSIYTAQKAISHMVDQRLQIKKSIKEPLISENGPHTIDDVKIMRLALEATLNKLITLRTEDILEEYINLQNQFENLLIEVFLEKEGKKQGQENI